MEQGELDNDIGGLAERGFRELSGVIIMPLVVASGGLLPKCA